MKLQKIKIYNLQDESIVQRLIDTMKKQNEKIKWENNFEQIVRIVSKTNLDNKK